VGERLGRAFIKSKVVDQIINELSANDGYPDQYAASDGIQQLLSISKQLIAIGFNKIIRTTRSFSTQNLAESYAVFTWATEKTTDPRQREFQRYFLTLATKSPYIEDFLAQEEGEHLIEYQHDLGTAFGVGLAELWGAPVLSLGSDEKFRVDYINASKTIVDEEGESSQTVQVMNLWDSGQLEVFRDEIERTAWQAVKNGGDLLAELPNLLPQLRVCDSASRQIERLSGGEHFFPEIIKHLLILHKTITAYTDGPFEPAGINWSVDSVPTLQQFSDCRTFVCQDGESRTFTCHSKILSANKRIYFFPLPGEGIMHIGYVGEHLPTVRHRT
jgi:hypothetical protein